MTRPFEVRDLSARDLLGLVTPASAGVCKFLSRFRHELPVIAFSVQRELQHSVGICLPDFTVRLTRPDDPVRILTTRTHDKFANPVLRISLALGILGCESLIVVIVAVDNYISATLIEDL